MDCTCCVTSRSEASARAAEGASKAALHAVREAADSNEPAISYAAIIVSLHFVVAPRIVADVLGLRYREILAPIVRPLLATLIMAPAPVVGRMVISAWTPLSLAAVIFAAGAVYAGAAWLLVVRDHERRRIRAATLGRLGLAH